MWCGKKAKSLHAEFALQMYICYISTNLGSVECLWSNVTDVCGKSLEMAHGLGGLIMVGMGMVARSNHGGQE